MLTGALVCERQSSILHQIYVFVVDGHLPRSDNNARVHTETIDKRIPRYPLSKRYWQVCFIKDGAVLLSFCRLVWQSFFRTRNMRSMFHLRHVYRSVVPTSLHFQLRDMLACPTDNFLFFVEDLKVCRMDLLHVVVCVAPNRYRVR